MVYVGHTVSTPTKCYCYARQLGYLLTSFFLCMVNDVLEEQIGIGILRVDMEHCKKHNYKHGSFIVS